MSADNVTFDDIFLARKIVLKMAECQCITVLMATSAPFQMDAVIYAVFRLICFVSTMS